eukprot:m51a1_g5453 hypothetical protein (426) ;mRNA; r:215789-217624
MQRCFAVVSTAAAIAAAPVLSGGGYCSEALGFALSLEDRIPVRLVQHGDAVSYEFMQGLEDRVSALVQRGLRTRINVSATAVVCHSEPGAWYPPLYQTSQCPPQGWGKFAYVVGRTMSETDAIPEEWVRRCNGMDEVWVPTQFHDQVFRRSGVDGSKIAVVPEPVDTRAFNLQVRPLPKDQFDKGGKFWFLSVAKWEERKNFPMLVRAFTEEFRRNESVALLVLTHEFHHEGTPIEEKIREITQSVKPSAEERPEVRVLQWYIPDRELPQLYASVDCLVVPSKGEGWGRPHIEAMATGVPVIATNWSGNTAFMTPENSYLIHVHRLSHPRTGPFQKFLWAEPSYWHLRALMREVFSNPEKAKQTGLRASRDVSSKYSTEAVGRLVMARLSAIGRVSGHQAHKSSSKRKEKGRLKNPLLDNTPRLK